MTSKEIVAVIKGSFASMNKDCEESFNQIERDLEILEILKNYLEVKSLDLAIEDIVLKGKDIIFVNCEKENDFNKIKEWLENE